MHFVKFHPEVASCLLSSGKRKYAPLGMRLLWKYIRNYFLVYQLISHFLLYLQNYKEFEAEILDLQSEKYGLSFDIKRYTTSGWAQGDENVIGIRAFNRLRNEVTFSYDYELMLQKMLKADVLWCDRHIAWPLRGYCTSYQKLACLVLYLKISNTFLKNILWILQEIVEGTQKWHWNFSRPSGF